MVKAIGFDLGDTLIQYLDVPLSWEIFYESALRKVLNSISVEETNEYISEGKEVLTKYNTRVNKRENEVSAEIIFSEMLEQWNLYTNSNLDKSIYTFFSYFQRKVVLFDDVIDTLRALKESNIKVGILIDVPYGMSNCFVQNDVRFFDNYVDIVVSSVDVGYRKPCQNGYTLLSNKLDVARADMIYVGNESKDIIGANNSNMKSALIDRDNKQNDYGQNYTLKSLREIIQYI